MRRVGCSGGAEFSCLRDNVPLIEPQRLMSNAQTALASNDASGPLAPEPPEMARSAHSTITRDSLKRRATLLPPQAIVFVLRHYSSAMGSEGAFWRSCRTPVFRMVSSVRARSEPVLAQRWSRRSGGWAYAEQKYAW